VNLNVVDFGACADAGEGDAVQLVARSVDGEASEANLQVTQNARIVVGVVATVNGVRVGHAFHDVFARDRARSRGGAQAAIDRRLAQQHQTTPFSGVGTTQVGSVSSAALDVSLARHDHRRRGGAQSFDLRAAVHNDVVSARCAINNSARLDRQACRLAARLVAVSADVGADIDAAIEAVSDAVNSFKGEVRQDLAADFTSGEIAHRTGLGEAGRARNRAAAATTAATAAARRRAGG